MPEFEMLIFFTLSALALLITPGPAVLYVVTRTLQQGRIAGLMSILGLCLGGLVHVIAAIFGLSALIASSASAFTVIQFAGAAYLLFLGVKALLSSDTLPQDQVIPVRSYLRLFVDGFIVNVFNPKTAIFFLAFLPQFVNRSQPDSVKMQLAVFGFLFIFLALLTDSLYAIMAGSFRSWLSRRAKVLRFQRYFSAAVYFFLGVSTALSGRKTG